MEALVHNYFQEFKPVTYVNQYRGPYNERKLGVVSFVEFGDQDTVKEFVKTVEDSNVQVTAGGKNLLVKAARTQKASSRNWALRKAEEMLRNNSDGADVKVEWKERVVKVGEDVAFKQEKDNLGTFKGTFASLVLP